ncbi:UDP-N-acetylmuramoyl-tripeptide--D-alanyl-D-alanine ligase [Pseudoruegeria sp. SK021]|uniref:UDP-N-acetylmuramoyl-tripeptide--D-alanyl-D- alanine ligase n=1 Tax=Pseudoruegeria sp. SK021 TaxID=1933035 RepID=UPI000A249B60|nr:UDP-N-acetylmuramoyl-tripeptide--D-alanyl-D-alanine ligase [Pseudoruegeria sp. SK021]OSP54997.1 UDP-N-acetylmuramoyl-tripeptide--D-alanyl-D-alanine ligase [Pseudoruegeria sp. SK021]
MSAPLWTSAAAVAATGGHATTAWQVDGLSIDTRSLQPGDLFVALTDQRDGHDFVADALRAGAGAALVSRVPEGLPPDAPLLVVGDVLHGLEDLARAARARTQAKVVAITGSVGKTSTKEMLRTALAPQGRVHAAEKSFNNHWGVPLTLARCPEDADFAVIEIGMNHPGEIAPLAELAQPDVAVVTIVAPAHLAAFDDLAGIAREKASIFSGLMSGGTAIVNGDLQTSPILTEAAGAATDHVVVFGADAAAQARLIRATVTPDATAVEAALNGAPLSFTLSTPGRHFAMNALAALAAVAALGGDPVQAAAALRDWTPPEGRGTRASFPLGPDGGATFDLLDDAYNANPTSIAAALDVLAACTPTGDRIAVLGDMLELGPDEDALHRGLASHPAMAAIARVHCVGPRMHHLWQALPAAQRGLWAPQAVDLAAQVTQLVGPGDTVLVKGSLGSKLRLVVDALTKMGHRPDDNLQGPGECSTG